MLGIVAIMEGKMVICSAQILEYVEVRTITLNWRKEKSHGRLGTTLTLLGKMCRRHYGKIDSKNFHLSISSSYIFTGNDRACLFESIVSTAWSDPCKPVVSTRIHIFWYTQVYVDRPSNYIHTLILISLCVYHWHTNKVLGNFVNHFIIWRKLYF